MKKFLYILIAVVGIMVEVNLGRGAYAEESPEVYIKAVNPGYTVDGVGNVGEMIEIARGGHSDGLISLAGLVVDYTNSSGKRAVLVEFPEHTYLAGESILLRLASSPESELAAITYAKTLALKAEGVRIMWGEKVVDAVCWDSSDGCEREFKSKEPTVLVRDDGDFGGRWKHVPVAEYGVEYKPEAIVVIEPEIVEPEPEVEPETALEPEVEIGYGGAESEISEEAEELEKMGPKCRDLVFSEILSYYDKAQSEQFIEIYNAGLEEVNLQGCQIRYKKKVYPLEGVIKADEYLVRYLADFSVAKNPSSVGVVELVDADGVTVDVLEYPHGQKKGTSYALVGYNEAGEGDWEITYAKTPGEANKYQEFRDCEAGKVINPATGNCVKIAETTKTEKTCPVGYYLNIATNRCRKIPVVVEKTCEDGYYLNDETGRCKKIVENNGASYEVEPEVYEEESSFVGLVAVFVVIGVAVIYVIFEFRHEIKKKLGFFRR